MSTPATMSGDAGVTVVVRRRVRPEAIAAFEAWLDGILRATAAFPGHLGASVARPTGGPSQDYVVIFRFDSEVNLARWEHSDERADWLSRVDQFTIGAVEVRRVTGLEFWFALPNNVGGQPPPAWKMAVVTFVGLFPLVQFLAPALQSSMTMLSAFAAGVVTLAVLVALMTWVVMPILIRLARPWLFRPAPNSEPVNQLLRPPRND